MKRTNILLLITIFLNGCAATKFNPVDDQAIQGFGTLTPFKIDDSYRLYIRQVVRTFDSTTNTYKPSNAIKFKTDSVIEIEYLLLSETRQQVIVFNNIPSIYQKLVEEKNRGFNLEDNTGSLEIDIRYFRQFRFGKLGEGGKLIFSNADNSGKDHIWNCTQNKDSINISSISIKDKHGEETKNTKEAFSLGILFRRFNSFKLIFEYKNAKKQNGIKVDLKDQTIYVSNPGNKYRVIFRFGYIIDGGSKTNIGFTKKRLYAAPAN
ncbi:MAG: hypothetical protein ABIQ88_03130 [Chitinophagaceae bacterium]